MEKPITHKPTISLIIMFPHSSSVIHRLVNNTLAHHRIIKDLVVVTNNKKNVFSKQGKNSKLPVHFIYLEKNLHFNDYRKLVEKRAVGTYVLYLDPAKAINNTLLEKQIRRIESMESVFQDYLSPSTKIFDDQKIVRDYWQILAAYREIKNTKMYLIGHLFWGFKKAISLRLRHLFHKKIL